jgi:hypothetical protein
VRYALRYDRPYEHTGPRAPATVVGKFSSPDAASAAAGVATLTYETEVAFYRELEAFTERYRAALDPVTLEAGR